MKGREGLGLGFGAFEKIKCIFSIAPVGTLEKLRDCSSLRNTHRTLVIDFCVRCYLTSASKPIWKHRTLRECPVVCVR